MRGTTWGLVALVALGATARAQTLIDTTAAHAVASGARATSGSSASRAINDVRAHVPQPAAGWAGPAGGSHAAGGRSAWAAAGDLGGRRSGGKSGWARRASHGAHDGSGRSAWARRAAPDAPRR
ncbi:MAG TPA: hypothetical protein VFD84_12480 [Candidatus Binatia bacterium]|nr:hypothetical protein [Candidatus Binatia bacterium]